LSPVFKGTRRKSQPSPFETLVIFPRNIPWKYPIVDASHIL
jgi:hypothetical protein